MANGIGGVQSGVGHIGLGQDNEPVNQRGQTRSEDAAQLRSIIADLGIGGSQTDKPKKVKAGTAEGAPRLDQAKGKSDIEKFFSGVGKGIKSLFTGLADKITGLFKPQSHHNLNLGNTPAAELTREAFVPLSFVAAEGEALPKSVSALTELQTQVDQMTKTADAKSDAAERAQIFGTLFRANNSGTRANKEFVASHVDFKSIAEDVISSNADQFISAAQKYEAFLEAAGEQMGMGIYSDLMPQATPKADAKAEAAREAVVIAVFETADRMLEAIFAPDGWVAELSDDLKAFTGAKLDLIAASDARPEEKAGMARSQLANDFVLRGVLTDFNDMRVGMDGASSEIVKNATNLVMSLVNNKTHDTGSNGYEPARELFSALRDTYKGARLDNFLQALGMPAEYRKDV